MATKCRATATRTGSQCGMNVLQNADFCYNHAPEMAKRRAESRRLGGLRRRRPKSTAALTANGAPQLRDVHAVLGVLEEAVADTLLQENSPTRSRTIAYLAGIVLKALELVAFEERLAVIEKAFGVDEAAQLGFSDETVVF